MRIDIPTVTIMIVIGAALMSAMLITPAAAAYLLTDRLKRMLLLAAVANVAQSLKVLRDDGTLVVHADQMVRDSNGDLRLSINSSVLPQGGYLIRIEGHARGGAAPQERV